MGKRWKVRKANAAKQERSREVIDRFYDNVLTELERIKNMPPEERDRLLARAPSSANNPPTT